MTETRKPPVRIKDIAKVLNMPVSTVGNILRGNPNYAEDLRRQVTESAEKMGYRRNILASGLRGGGTNTVGVLWSLGSKQIAAELIRELSYQCFARGHTTLVSDSRSDENIILEVLAGFMDRRVDNVVFQWGDSSGKIPEAILGMLRNFPNVVLVQAGLMAHPLKTITASVEKGIEQMVEFWCAAGRKKPAIVIPTKNNPHKVKCFSQAFSSRGIHVDQDTVLDINSNDSMCSRIYYDFMNRRFLNSEFSYDCLFCGTDEGALGVIQWLRDNHYRIPQDVAVCGFNNSEFTEFSYPPVASVGCCVDDLVNALMQQLFSESSLCEQISVPFKFYWRESAGEKSS